MALPRHQPFERDTRPRDARWKAEVEALRAAARADPSALGRLGDLLRAGGRPAEARKVLERAVALSTEAGDERARRANIIRLATAEFYDGDHPAAIKGLEALLVEIENSDDDGLLDFAAQHLGKAWAEVGGWVRAAGLFGRALSLRSDPALIASSQAALDAVSGRDGAFVAIVCNLCGALHAYHSASMGYMNMMLDDDEVSIARGFGAREGQRFWLGVGNLDDAVHETPSELAGCALVEVELLRVLRHDARSARARVRRVRTLRWETLRDLPPPDTSFLDELTASGYGSAPVVEGAFTVRSACAQGDIGAWSVSLNGVVVLAGEWNFYRDVFWVSQQV